jgi:hypothetical protein
MRSVVLLFLADSLERRELCKLSLSVNVKMSLILMSRKVTDTPEVIDEAITNLESLTALDGVKHYLWISCKNHI